MLRISKKSRHIYVHCVRLPYNATNIFKGISITLCFYHHTQYVWMNSMISGFSFPIWGHILVVHIRGKFPEESYDSKCRSPKELAKFGLPSTSHRGFCSGTATIYDVFTFQACSTSLGYVPELMDIYIVDSRTHVVGDWGEEETWKDMRCACWKILFEVRAWNCSEVTSCTVSRANRVEADEGRDASFPRNVWSIIGFYHWFSWVSFVLSYATNYNYSNVTTVCGKDGMMKRYFRRGLIQILDFIKAQEFNWLRWQSGDTNRDDKFHAILLAIYCWVFASSLSEVGCFVHYPGAHFESTSLLCRALAPGPYLLLGCPWGGSGWWMY